jgi:hypothetical protein
MSNVETTPCAGGFSKLSACGFFRSATNGVDHRMVRLRDSEPLDPRAAPDGGHSVGRARHANRVERPHHHSVKSSEPPANPLKPPAKSVKYLG